MLAILNCPKCRRKLQVPDALQGQPVQCPVCRTIFVPESAAVPPPEGGREAKPPRQPEPPYATPEPYTDEEPWPRSRRGEAVDDDRARQVVLGPALALIVTGVLGIAINLLQVVWWIARPDQMQMQEAKLAELFGGGAVPPGGPGVGKFFGMLFAALSLIILMGGVRMFSLHSYGLALAGCILAMINLGNGCCCLGLPVGIWGLVVLLLPSVREAFQGGPP